MEFSLWYRWVVPPGILFHLTVGKAAPRYFISDAEWARWCNSRNAVTYKLANDHSSFVTNAIRQVLITFYEFRLSVVDFAAHRFFSIPENGDKMLWGFRAVDVHLERRFQFWAGLTYLNGFFASHNEVAPFRPDTDKNGLAHSTTSGGSGSGAQNFTAP